MGSLFERVRMTMPEDGPGRLSDREYSDMVAYMLDRNDYPAGEIELPADKTARGKPDEATRRLLDRISAYMIATTE